MVLLFDINTLWSYDVEEGVVALFQRQQHISFLVINEIHPPSLILRTLHIFDCSITIVSLLYYIPNLQATRDGMTKSSSCSCLLSIEHNESCT